MRLPWLETVLRSAGQTTMPLAGWEARGVDLGAVAAIVFHATITPRTTRDDAVAHILRDGRPDLKGPLCQLGLDRQGRWWIIAAGKGNHNGLGRYANNTVGIEAFNDGHEPWPAAQLEAWRAGTAALCQRLNLPVDHVRAHRETDPRRKTDPRGVDMDAERAAIAALLVPAAPPVDDGGVPWLLV